jgi:hypothetical protein
MNNSVRKISPPTEEFEKTKTLTGVDALLMNETWPG